MVMTVSWRKSFLENVNIIDGLFKKKNSKETVIPNNGIL